MTEMTFALIEAEDPQEFGRDLTREFAAAGQSGVLPTISFSHTALLDGRLHYAAVVVRPSGGDDAEFEMKRS
jgi:hypothetical protein